MDRDCPKKVPSGARKEETKIMTKQKYEVNTDMATHSCEIKKIKKQIQLMTKTKCLKFSEPKHRLD